MFKRYFFALPLSLALVAACVEQEDVERSGDSVEGDCVPTLEMLPAGGATAGDLVQFVALGNCSDGDPGEFRFWIQYPNGTWVVAQDHAANSTFDWQTLPSTANGDYTIQVWARKTGSTSLWDGVATVSPYSVSGGGTDCSVVKMATTPGTTATTGSLVAIDATASCEAPEYLYWVKDPAGNWTNPCGADYTSSATCQWNTLPLAPASYPTGTYELQVWARSQGGGPPEGFAAQSGFTLTQGASKCYSVGLSAPEGHQGDKITITAAPGCIGTPMYQFWLKEGSKKIKQLCDWSTKDTCTWNSNSYDPGTFTLSVFAKTKEQAKNTPSATATLSYGLLPEVFLCDRVDLQASPGSGDAAVGDNIMLEADAQCEGSLAPEYLYWVQTEAGWIHPPACSTWTTDEKCSWDTAGMLDGDHEIQVWARAQGSTEEWESFDSITYALNPPASGCYKVDLTVAPSTGATVGSSVALSALASCSTGSPEYLFWTRDPASQYWYAPCGGYSSTAACTWDTTGYSIGNAEVQVWVRPQGSSVEFESYDLVTVFPLQ